MGAIRRFVVYKIRVRIDVDGDTPNKEKYYEMLRKIAREKLSEFLYYKLGGKIRGELISEKEE